MGEPAREIITIDDDDDDAELQRALALSLKDHSHVTFGQVNIDGEDDDDLKQALALSLQDEQSKPYSWELYAPSDTRPAEDSSAAASAAVVSSATDTDILLPEQLPSLVLNMEVIDAYYSKIEPFDIESFHSVMWDENLTTENDKSRWIEQPITMRSDEVVCQDSSEPVGDDEIARLDRLAKSHVPWGLVQQHGGPCGVLAAVQAEMLRYLIWGPLPSSSFLSADALLEALARALGTILARAALTNAVEISSDCDMQGCEGTDSCSGKEREIAVKLVLPSPDSKNIDRPLTWEAFEPWQSVATTNGPDNTSSISSVRSSFTTYTITSTSSSVDSGQSKSCKRQKTGSSELGNILDSQEKEEQEMLLLDEIDRLARHVSAFLLQARAGGFPPINHFRHAGGVLLLVMSLVTSRGHAKLRAEFDDPIGARLTGQFGHCSQELINVLLTGQAVSNVFDNTLKPSGDMICRGIRAKPVVGYLTQLEALQYCSVGSYFKSPRIPVWIIASSSHFSVLFGPKKAIQESASDMLLEKCRRAFKSVEGGEENGFIPTESLSFVLSALNCNLDPPKVSALRAALEVTGAGIILWDDFWKAISRLLTGAAIETVLEGQVASDQSPASQAGKRNTGQYPSPPFIHQDMIAQNAVFSDDAVTSSSSSLEPAFETRVDQAETDEEMARRLAGEWGNEDANSVSAVNGGSPITLPFTDQEDDEVDTGDSKPAAKGSTGIFDFETYGNTFSLYHYNGLRGGVLSPFRVTRLTPEEAVGASIALSRANSASAQSTDLEEVVRTKWPSCAFDFLGKPPPLID
jgi:hypothetical protein